MSSVPIPGPQRMTRAELVEILQVERFLPLPPIPPPAIRQPENEYVAAPKNEYDDIREVRRQTLEDALIGFEFHDPESPTARDGLTILKGGAA